MSRTFRIWFNQISHRTLFRLVLAVTAVGIVLVSFTPLEDLSYDLSFQIKPITTITNAVLIYANKQTLSTLPASQRTLDRTNHVRLLNRLKQDGARLVFYDYAFTGPDKDPKVDQALAQAITNHGSVILVVGGESSESTIGLQDRLLRSNTPAVLLEAANRSGHAELLGTMVKVVRGISGRFQNTDYAVWVAANQIEPEMFANEDPNFQRWLNYYGRPNRSAIERCSFEEVFRNEVSSNFFARKFVFVGQAIPGEDAWATPFSRFGLANPMPGVEIHATALLNLLNDDWLRLVPKPWQWLTAAMWAIISVTGLYSLSRKPMIVMVLAAILGAALLAAASFYVQWHFHWWWSWIGPVFGQTTAALIFVSRRPKPDPYIAFVSYRTEEDGAAALLIEKSLAERGYKAFIDVQSLAAGPFSEQLLHEIENSTFFILILSPKSLARCVEQNDWVLKELTHALLKKKRIIPVFKGGFSFDAEKDGPQLPQIMELRKYQGVHFSNREFEGFMQRLTGLLELH